MDPGELATIAIPTYNREKLLRRALASALAQDYSPLRIVVCDNASPDGTHAYLRSVADADSRVEVIHHEKNIGAAANYEVARAAAGGSYFMWLADDDWLEPNYVTACVRALRAVPGAVLAAPATSYYHDDRHAYDVPPLSLIAPAARERVAEYLRTVSMNDVFYGVYRRASMADVPIYRGYGGDWQIMADVIARGTVVACHEARLHRSLDGISSDGTQLTTSVNVPRLFRRTPWHGLAWQLFSRVALGRAPFGDLSRSERIVSGAEFAKIVMDRFPVRPWRDVVRPEVGRVVRRVLPAGVVAFLRR